MPERDESQQPTGEPTTDPTAEATPAQQESPAHPEPAQPVDGTPRASETSPKPRFRDAPVSFVRRSHRMSDAQEKAWEENSPLYLVEVPRSFASTSVDPEVEVDPAELFGRAAPLTVEIGSGQGHAIVHAASAHPERNFLAIEVYRAGLARTVFNAHSAGLTNLRLVDANAPEVLSTFLPAGSVDEVWIFFPDPWHKKRHTKRRMVKEGFPEVLHRALSDGGRVRLASDWEDYALQMREVLDAADGFEREFDGEWAPRFDGRVMTAFERKGLEKGREIRDLVYRRTPLAQD